MVSYRALSLDGRRDISLLKLIYPLHLGMTSHSADSANGARGADAVQHLGLVLGLATAASDGWWCYP